MRLDRKDELYYNFCSEFETILTLNKTRESKNMSERTRKLCQGAIIAALYVVLTLLSSAFGLASGAIQLRLSEALTVLPLFTAAAIPGLTVGCILANLITGCVAWDIIGGSFATLLGALGTYFLSRSRYTAPIWPILANTIIVPFILLFAYQAPGSYFYFALTVGIGEILSCGVLGILLAGLVQRLKIFDKKDKTIS